MSTRYVMNEPSVVSEIIDGEAVIVHLQSGHYFSTGGAGSLAWSWLGRGASAESVATALAAHFDIDEADAASAVRDFVARLLGHELLREEAAAPGFDPRAEPAPPARATWAAPTLDVYADMEDLLLLDPIHDVDEAGWPLPRQPDTPVA